MEMFQGLPEQIGRMVGFAVVVIGLLVIVTALIAANRSWPYRKVALMSPVEQKFYWVLREALPRHHIMTQVQLSRVIRPPKGRNEWKWLNKIIRLSLDYVVLDEKLEVVLVLELDDKSHLLKERKEADQRKDKALKAAGVKIIRVSVRDMPTKQQVAAWLH